MASNSDSCAATRSRQAADHERKQLRRRMEMREEMMSLCSRMDSSMLLRRDVEIHATFGSV